MNALHYLDYLVHDRHGFAKLCEGLTSASLLAIEHCTDTKETTVVYSMNTQDCMVYVYDNFSNRAKISDSYGKI